MNKNVYYSAYISLIVQFLIGIVCIYAYYLDGVSSFLKDILKLEIVVQMIEFTFYVWLVMNFSQIKMNVTIIRYFDWFITTPTMLFSMIAFMIYYKKIEEEKNPDDSLSIYNIYNENQQNILLVLLLNFIMLLFGFLGELKIINKMIAFLVGTVSLIYSFNIIFNNFVQGNKVNEYVYWSTFILWPLYGVAYLFSYNIKNTIYNILDIFSKNISALAVVLYVVYKAAKV